MSRRITTQKNPKGVPGTPKIIKRAPSKPLIQRKKDEEPKPPPEKKEFVLPPLSIMKPKPPEKVEETEQDKLKKKTIRRNIPQGEDLKQLKEIVKSIKGKDVTVQEFVGLVAPYTGDNGEGMRNVMTEDLNNFRKLVNKIYDTMTKDVSDVLKNEHLQLTSFYKEKHAMLTDRMMRAIDTILALCPGFNFENYYSMPTYLDTLFPIPEETVLTEEELYMQKRQQAYHRLQWLRTEGERLNEENNQLQNRLTQIKKEQRREILATAKAEQAAEAMKEQLEQAQAAMQQKLEVLNNSVEQAIVEREQEFREKEDTLPAKTVDRSKAFETKSRVSVKVKEKKPEWNVQVAAQIEEGAIEDTVKATVSKGSVKTGAIKKIPSKAKIKKPKVRKNRDKSPFHFSPIKSPTQEAPPKERSPFHFSPIKTPPEARRGATRERSPFHYSPPQAAARAPTPPRAGRAPSPIGAAAAESTRIQTTVTRQLPPPRPSLAPRDSWGGFY